MNKKGELHSVVWDYSTSEFSDDYEAITFTGKCENCDIEFEITYSNPLLSIISKSTGEVSNFNFMVEHIN